MKGKLSINLLKVKELMNRKKISQEDLAAMIGMARPTLSINLNKGVVNYGFMEQIAKVLEVDVSEIEQKQNESEFVGYQEIKSMMETIISQQAETIKSLQKSVENLSMALGKHESIMNKSEGVIIPLHYSQVA